MFRAAGWCPRVPGCDRWGGGLGEDGGMEMRAVVLDGPVAAGELRVSRVKVPEPGVGWVRIKVEAFGLNRSEYHLRAGLATGAKFPIIPGIEAAGTVDLAPGGEFTPGQQVVAMMGGMGRQYDGGYAEYTVVPAIPCRIRIIMRDIAQVIA